MPLFKIAPLSICKQFCCTNHPTHQQIIFLSLRSSCFFPSKKSKVLVKTTKERKYCFNFNSLNQVSFLHSSSKKDDTSLSANTNSNIIKDNCQSEFLDIDFNNVEDAYNSKTVPELFRALFVFHLCNISWLVANGLQVSKYIYI